MITDNPNSEAQENIVNPNEETANQSVAPQESHDSEVHEEETHDMVEHHEHEKMTSGELMTKLEALINAEDAGANHKKFNAVKEMLLHKINLESENQKEADAHYEHPLQSKISALSNIFKWEDKRFFYIRKSSYRCTLYDDEVF